MSAGLRTALIAAVALLGGCASPLQPARPPRPAAAQEEFMRDRTACLQQETLRASNEDINRDAYRTSWVSRSAYAGCMIARGHKTDENGDAFEAADSHPSVGH